LIALSPPSTPFSEKKSYVRCYTNQYSDNPVTVTRNAPHLHDLTYNAAASSILFYLFTSVPTTHHNIHFIFIFFYIIYIFVTLYYLLPLHFA